MTIKIAAQTARQALAEILQVSGRAVTPQDSLTITGREACLPSAFPVASLGAGALAACGLGLSDLWALRTGKGQSVSIDLKPAAASLRSVNLMRFDSEMTPDLFDPLFGYYPTGDDRWVQLHTNFPHTRERALQVLGARPERKDAERAVRQWAAAELEQAMADAGACAAFVRTPAEWQAHPQHAAVNELPLMQIEKIGDSPPEPLTTGKRPLDGIKALDLTRVLAGPTCGRTLAEHGAQVMRISGPHLPSVERCVIDTGHGKLAAFVDLRDSAQVEHLRALAAQADLFCQAYRPGTIAERGFSPEALAELRPGIVYVSLSAYSHVGPWSARRGYDTLVQCTTGICHEQAAGPHGEPGATPSHLPGSVLDYVTGYLAAYGAIRALYLRATQGGSYRVQVSLVQTAEWLKRFTRLDASQYKDVPVIGSEDAADWMVQSETDWGRIHHLGPVLQLSETPGYWARPVSRLGTHPARW